MGITILLIISGIQLETDVSLVKKWWVNIDPSKKWWGHVPRANYGNYVKIISLWAICVVPHIVVALNE